MGTISQSSKSEEEAPVEEEAKHPGLAALAQPTRLPVYEGVGEAHTPSREPGLAAFELPPSAEKDKKKRKSSG
jgi:hypothetical protein